MKKKELKDSFYELLKPLENDGVTVQGSDSETVSNVPLVTFSILSKNNLLNQDNIDRWVNYFFIVNIYTNNSVQCTEISDDIDDILKPLGFEETDVSEAYDRNSGKHRLVSVYSRRMDENGISYNIK